MCIKGKRSREGEILSVAKEEGEFMGKYDK
jgi:hypothetical protein